MVQAHSAYFYFRVLPDLKDPGFYSDQAVLSRTFVHENTYFQLITVFASLYYFDPARSILQSTFAGRVIESIFVFWPFVLVRQWFPTTRFSDAGSGSKSRTKKNELFYDIGTKMVKFFYLWAKYFLGFYINFLCFLDKLNGEDMRMVRGLFILNLGTISISVFLHTLRFKKVLSPKVTFSFYMVQIYLTFYGIPFFCRLFVAHKKLGGLIFLGLLCNMTRNLKIHAAWCGILNFLLTCTYVDW